MAIDQPEWLEGLEGIFEVLNEGIAIVDDCSDILFVNERFEQMTGIPRSDVVGKNVSHFYTPQETAVIFRQRDHTLRIGRNRFEFVVPQKDGNRLPVIISSRTIEDPDGRQFGIITFADISEQKRAEARLRDANAQLEERQREIDEDLLLAARVQQSLAPQSLLWDGLRVEAFFQPVRSIGGDFGLVAPADEDHLDLLVCDVSGHGIGSALVANRIYTETMTQLSNKVPLATMLRHLNRFVMQNIGGSVFYFTLAGARIERGGHRMVYAGAGHPPAILVRTGQDPHLLESRSLVLGVLADAVGMEATLELDLEPGDRLVLYTDGITDVFNAKGEMLGVEGVQKFVRETSSLPLDEMKRELLDRVASWREGPANDDISLVLVEVA